RSPLMVNACSATPPSITPSSPAHSSAWSTSRHPPAAAASGGRSSVLPKPGRPRRASLPRPTPRTPPCSLCWPASATPAAARFTGLTRAIRRSSTSATPSQPVSIRLDEHPPRRPDLPPQHLSVPRGRGAHHLGVDVDVAAQPLGGEEVGQAGDHAQFHAHQAADVDQGAVGAEQRQQVLAGGVEAVL